MMAEIVARGPIACTIAVTAAFENYVSGIFNDTTGARVSYPIEKYQSVFRSGLPFYFTGSGSRDFCSRVWYFQ